MTDILIKVEGVSKKFCRSLKKSLWYGMQDLGNELRGQRHGGDGELRPNEFWAVKDVSFELKRGECLGLIGRNGAGKTTLLRMLNGLIKPDRGRIEMRGRMGALIALGTGMKPVLTGRENIYVSAALRGFSRHEIDQKADEIIDFSEIGEFIDSPMQNYSSGMSVRLNFAVASALEPDILLLDEVLAVGDTAFRNKCYHRIAKLRKKSALIFVSHNMDQIARTATTALVMKAGQPIVLRPVEEAVAIYEHLNTDIENINDAFLSLHPPIKSFESIFSTQSLRSGESLKIDLKIISDCSVKKILFKVLFYNSAGAFAADGALTPEKHQFTIQPGETHLCLTMPFVPLKNGKYDVAINLIDSFGDLLVWSYKMHSVLVYDAYGGAIADCQLTVCDCGRLNLNRK